MKSPKFDTAYVRMTAWYVVIIMTISLLFSFWVYNQARSELRFGLNRAIQLKTMANEFTGVPIGGHVTSVNDQLQDSSGRLLNQLVILNIGVLIAGSAASYWLARRTMRPIEESMEAQERFTADASHELRTPLAAMKAEIEVGLRQAKALTKDEATTLLKSNLEEIDRLQGLADGLLTLTQNDARPDIKPVALEDVTSRVSQRLQPLAEAKKMQLTKELIPVTVTGDEETLDKIISILLDNAIKYSPENKTVNLRTYQKDSFGFVEVQDGGVGIKASELPHIFDRFYRADNSRSKQHVAGHGLGLSIAQKLAENMSAKITATSTPGKGSIFTIKLPM